MLFKLPRDSFQIQNLTDLKQDEKLIFKDGYSTGNNW